MTANTVRRVTGCSIKRSKIFKGILPLVFLKGKWGRKIGKKSFLATELFMVTKKLMTKPIIIG